MMTIAIYELHTTKGRMFRVAVNNKNQRAKLFAKYSESHHSSNEDRFTSIKEVLCGIHDISTFEGLVKEMNI